MVQIKKDLRVFFSQSNILLSNGLATKDSCLTWMVDPNLIPASIYHFFIVRGDHNRINIVFADGNLDFIRLIRFKDDHVLIPDKEHFSSIG
jgi:hypothetical protein